MEESKETSEKFMRRISQKFEANPELQEEIDLYLSRLFEIFGHQVDLNIHVDGSVESYMEVFNSYNDGVEIDEEIDEIIKNDGIPLRDFVNILKDEEVDFGHYIVYFDPINLKSGLNKIKDFLVTTLDDNDKFIIIPTMK